MKRGRIVGPLKVAHISTVDMSLRYMLLNQMLSIRQAGYQVYGISAPGPEIASVQAAGIPYFPVHMTRNLNPLADLRALGELYRVMRRERFTIVHTHTPKAGLLGQLAARIAGVPVVVNTVHGFYFHEGMHPSWRRFYILMESIAARCSDLLLSQNQEDIRTAIGERICSPEKIKYLGNGFDVQAFDQACLDGETLARTRSELGIPPAARVVGFVGRLVAEKGLLELLSAAQQILQQIENVRFLIVGPVDAEKRDGLTPAVASEYGIEDMCIFTGRRADMPQLYALMDVLVLPSHREGFPRTPMEASLLGIPCVVTDVRGCREAVQNGQNGLVVPLGDIEKLAGAILSILNDPELARKLGETGRRVARERFDERRVFQTVIDEYAGLLQRKHVFPPQIEAQPNLSMSD